MKKPKITKRLKIYETLLSKYLYDTMVSVYICNNIHRYYPGLEITDLPELYKQKPRGLSIKKAWWPDYIVEPRIIALQIAIKDAKSNMNPIQKFFRNVFTSKIKRKNS